jgi:hypothetical protein
MLDVSPTPHQSRLCNGLSRRDFIRIGALAPVGLSLANLLSFEKAMAGAASQARAKSVILVFLGGGISHHDTFDPKPDAVEEIRGKYKGHLDKCARSSGHRSAPVDGSADGQGDADPLRHARE